MLDEIQAQMSVVQELFLKLEQAMEKLEDDFNAYIAWEEEREIESETHSEEL